MPLLLVLLLLLRRRPTASWMIGCTDARRLKKPPTHGEARAGRCEDVLRVRTCTVRAEWCTDDGRAELGGLVL